MKRLALWEPVTPEGQYWLMSAPLRIVADHVKLPPRTGVFLYVQADIPATGTALLEGSCEVPLKEIGFPLGLAQLHDWYAEVLVTNFRDETQLLTEEMGIAQSKKVFNITASVLLIELPAETQFSPDTTPT